MTLTNPIVEDIRRVVGDAQMAGRVLNIRAEAALLRFEHPTEPCLIEEIADALVKPRSLSMLVSIVGRGGMVAVQSLLMQMRDEGLVKFDIKKGLWSRA